MSTTASKLLRARGRVPVGGGAGALRQLALLVAVAPPAARDRLARVARGGHVALPNHGAGGGCDGEQAAVGAVSGESGRLGVAPAVPVGADAEAALVTCQCHKSMKAVERGECQWTEAASQAGSLTGGRPGPAARAQPLCDSESDHDFPTAT